MFSKVIVFVAFIALACSAPQHEQPARYPAGVNANLCPGYPICDNSLLHGTAPVAPSPVAHSYSAPAPQWNHAIPATQWNHGAPAHSWNNYVHAPQPVWNQWSAPVAQHWDESNDLSGPGGDKYPAGVNPSFCPNYPYCDTGASAHIPQAAPLPGYTSRQYPAGVNPATCPNYPTCN